MEIVFVIEVTTTLLHDLSFKNCNKPDVEHRTAHFFSISCLSSLWTRLHIHYDNVSIFFLSVIYFSFHYFRCRLPLSFMSHCLLSVHS